MYTLHREIQRAALTDVASLIDRVMGDASASIHAKLLDALRTAHASLDDNAAMHCIFSCSDGGAVLADLLAVCCHGHVEGAVEVPKHDGKYVAACFESLESCGGFTAEGLRTLAAKVRQRASASALRRAVTKAHFDRHKLHIIHAFAHRSERFLAEHPWEAHRHEMPALTFGFSTNERRFTDRRDLWEALQDGWYHAEDLQDLHNLTKESVVNFDFDAWKAAHRHFLPGYHLYSRKNLSLSKGSFAAYLSQMQKDLDDHYAGRNNPLYRRNYTAKMQAWVEPYARHIFQEFQMVSAFERISFEFSGDVGAEELSRIVAGVWVQFPELLALPSERQTIRRQHMEVLALEALSHHGPTVVLAAM